ncbi:MAG TPA: hypothetical protein VMA13_10960 [Candidatus Saccharimonadales bacterium]|nr:hypothetical protein [Candidatus Saccharimonadales bacterium]
MKFLLGLVLIFSGLLGCTRRAAIVYPKAPDGGQEVVSEGMKTLSRSISRYLGGFQIEDLTLAQPFRDYSVGPTNLAAGQLLSAAKPGEWHYPLMHGTNAVAAAELVADKEAGKPPKFAGLDTSNFSKETLEALRIAEQLPQIEKQDYEVRRLDCPPILFVAVWLHGRSDDIIIPLPNTFGRWKAYQPYSESQMIELLKPEASKKLKAPTDTLD